MLDLLAAAARTRDLFLVMTGKGQYLREFFLAVVAEELVLGHGGTSMMQKGNEKIVDPFDRQFNMGSGLGFCVVDCGSWWGQSAPLHEEANCHDNHRDHYCDLNNIRQRHAATSGS